MDSTRDTDIGNIHNGPHTSNSGSHRSFPNMFTTPSSVRSLWDPTSSTGSGRGTTTDMSQQSRDQDKSSSTPAVSRSDAAGSKSSSNMSALDINCVSASDNDQVDDEICLSVSWLAGNIGIAYYNASTTEVYLMADTVDSDDFPILCRVLLQTKPKCIVTSTKEDENVLNAIRNTMNPDGNLDPQYLQVLPSVDFSLPVSKQRIMGIKLASIPQGLTDTERKVHIESLIPFSNLAMIKALGGLAKFVEKHQLGMGLDDSDMRVQVLAIKMFSLDDLMNIDEQTFHALNIFQQVNHPSLNKTSYKEDISLCRMLDRCSSKSGSKLLRLWLLQPLTNKEKLNARYDCIEYFANPRTVEITVTIQKYIRQMKDCKNILSRMSRAHATVNDWQVLYKTVYSAIYIADICKQQNVELPIVKKIEAHFSDDLYKIANLISNIVDFEESAAQDRFVVKMNVDPDLDEKKRIYRGLPDFMTQVARDELATLGDAVTTCNVFYLPQLGYLLCIPVTDTMKEQDYILPGLEFIFISNNVANYKSARMNELDRMLGDTQCDITDYETGIMHKLQNIILEHASLIVDVMQCAAELDCLLSLATCTREFNYVRPKLTEENMLLIKNGRHPILDGTSNITFVPNNTYSGAQHSRMKVLTGPNASGKSIYIKQIAMIVYMAQIGSFVPADQATIGITDGIYTRVKTTESISVGLSSFMLDLNQISSAMRSATERSLVLLDEFGTGTTSTDGLALLSSSLQYWLDRGSMCPHIFVSTHFYRIHEQQFLSSSPHISFQTMDVLQDGEEIIFLFQLKEGHTTSSFAQMVARQVGLSEDVLKRSDDVSKQMKETNMVGNRLGTDSTDTKYKRCMAISDRFLDLDLDSGDIEGFRREFVIPVYQGTLAV